MTMTNESGWSAERISGMNLRKGTPVEYATLSGPGFRMGYYVSHGANAVILSDTAFAVGVGPDMKLRREPRGRIEDLELRALSYFRKLSEVLEE